MQLQEAKFRAQISDLQDRVEQLIQEKDDAVFEHEELLKVRARLPARTPPVCVLSRCEGLSN